MWVTVLTACLPCVWYLSSVLESAERLFAAIAIMRVVALHLIELRERLRRDPNAEAAQSGLSSLELQVLCYHLEFTTEGKQ